MIEHAASFENLTPIQRKILEAQLDAEIQARKERREFDEDIDASKRLSRFLRAGWHVLEPATIYRHNWHTDCISEHLEAVTDGEIKRLIINVPPGQMKALEDSTPVMTLCGWKRHGDLRVGDYVYAPDGRLREVLGVSSKIFETAYRVTFDDGSEIDAGGAHLWSIEREEVSAATKWRRKRSQTVVPTTDLLAANVTKGTYARPDRIPVTAPIYLPPRDYLIDPYIFGAWLGDGSSSSGHIYVAGHDLEHFRQHADAVVQMPQVEGCQPFYRIKIDGLQTRLRLLGVLHDKHIPDQYLMGSIEQRLALLQGLMDTDGMIDADGMCHFTNKNRGIADGVKELAESLGCKAFLTSRYTILNGTRYGPHFKVTFAPQIQVFRLPRKAARVKSQYSVRTRHRYVKSVESVGKKLVKCISVEGGVYLAGRSNIATHNSLQVSVFWPAYEWGPRNLPHLRSLSTSYREKLAYRDNRKARNLMMSAWYQERWGSRFAFRSDAMGARRYENDKSGFREAMPFGSLTGERGDRVIIDDPLSVDQAKSDVQRNKARETFLEAVPNRLVDPMTSAIVMIMQRLHEDDPSGIAMAKGLGYEHVMLPTEFEAERRCYTVVMPKHFDAGPPIRARYDADKQVWYPDGAQVPANRAEFVAAAPLLTVYNQDPRTADGELLNPGRFPREAVERDKASLGSMAYAGQNQQRPAPRGGGMFKRADFIPVKSIPEGAVFARGWDLAATSGENVGARTAGVKIGKLPDGRFIVAHMIAEAAGPFEVRSLLKRTAGVDGEDCRIAIPQDPGSAGKVQSRDLIAALAGYVVSAKPVTGDKATRAEPFAAQVEAGNVLILVGPWNEEYLDEISTFPNGKRKDIGDASAEAFNALARVQEDSGFAAPILIGKE